MKKKIIILLALIPCSIIGSDFNKLLSEKNIFTQYSPNKKHIYISNLNVDTVIKLKNEYIFNEIVLNSNTEGFWMVYSIQDSKIVFFDYETLNLYQVKWDLDNNFFIKDWGTGMLRSYEIFDLANIDFKKNIKFNGFINKEGYIYSKEKEMFAVKFLTDDYVEGIDVINNISNGIKLFNKNNERIIDILPEYSKNKLEIINFQDTLSYQEITIDEKIISKKEYNF